MAQSSLARCLAASRTLRILPLFRATPATKQFSTSATVLQRRRYVEEVTTRRTNSVLEDDMEDLWDELEYPADVLDAPSSGHLYLQQQRLLLKYLRLIEHEMPKLVAFRKPFVPPTRETPLIVRSMHYQGEHHPATRKRVIVVAVDDLPLANEAAKHKFILLAGPRWTLAPPKDAGASQLDDWGNGYIKISCEDFPHDNQNLKWASDTLDKLVSEANTAPETYSDVPLDLRHLVRKTQKAKKGDHLRGLVFIRPSIRDFPQEWLPSSARPEAAVGAEGKVKAQ